MKPTLTDRMVPVDLQHDVEQFLFHEVGLLDDCRWSDWLELFTAEGMYWVPRSREQQEARHHVSLFWEDARLRSVRVRRITNARNWSQQPQTYSVRVIGNVRLQSVQDDEVRVRSSFQMLESRGGHQRAFGGWYTHTLVPAPDRIGGYSIALKRIDLLNCDAVHENLQVFF